MSARDINDAPAETTSSYVLFPIGSKRFALPSQTVTELARPARQQSFPHTTPHLTGVLLRRGHIVPVCDIAQVLSGSASTNHRFYLIANRELEHGERESIALPVDGECELSSASMRPRTGKLPPYVEGLLSLPDEIVEVLDLEKVIAAESRK